MREFKRNAPPSVRPVQRDRLSWNQFSADPSRYDRMPYRYCGKSGLKLSALSLGLWETFDGNNGLETARECIFRAFNLGITHYDLASSYGNPPGRAETIAGRIFREMPRDELIISTKAGFPIWPGPYGEGISRKHLISSLDQSLERLGLDYVDIFYAHRHDPDVPLEETIGALDQIIRAGKALYAGLGNYRARPLLDACKLAETKNWAPIVVNQTTCNLLEQETSGGSFILARETGTGLIVCSPLAQGLLSNKYVDIPEESRAARAWTEDERAQWAAGFREKLRKLEAVARDRGQTLSQMALVWALSLPEVTSVLMGVSEIAQVDENVKALENPDFSEDDLRRIDDILRAD